MAGPLHVLLVVGGLLPLAAMLSALLAAFWIRDGLKRPDSGA
jgi:hypothetical protein